MKARNLLLLAAALIVGLTAAGASYAHGGRGGFHRGGARVGVFIGAPVFAYGYGYRPYYPYSYYPYYYPPAYYPYVVPAPVVVQPATPPVYIERSDEQAATPSTDYWYYCPDTKSYYPYVGTCASPWQRVAPQPPQS